MNLAPPRISGSAPSNAPPSPGKAPGAFRTISEVADFLGVQQHVLRFWETKFSQVRPLKRGGGRRYYRPEDVALLRTIHQLLYTEKYTIKGVQKLLKEKGRTGLMVISPATALTAPASSGLPLNAAQRRVLQGVLSELRDLRNMIDG
ncbi:MAG: MerR family transcriptional regulator [Alphaproteobacteria bacterium]|nr:MerR family transcriptional regulator [Alphaproteobacteria bacterium]